MSAEFPDNDQHDMLLLLSDAGHVDQHAERLDCWVAMDEDESSGNDASSSDDDDEGLAQPGPNNWNWCPPAPTSLTWSPAPMFDVGARYDTSRFAPKTPPAQKQSPSTQKKRAFKPKRTPVEPSNTIMSCSSSSSESDTDTDADAKQQHTRIARSLSNTKQRREQALAKARQRTKPKPKRRVRFGPEVKTHDGLREEHALLDKLIDAFMVKRTIRDEKDVLRQMNGWLDRLSGLKQQVAELCNRIQIQGCSYVLPQGGGLCIKLSAAHMPHLQALESHMGRAVIMCDRFAAFKAVQAKMVHMQLQNTFSAASTTSCAADCRHNFCDSTPPMARAVSSC